MRLHTMRVVRRTEPRPFTLSAADLAVIALEEEDVD